MPCLVQGAHHRLELLHLSAGSAAAAVLRVRGEEADGVVAPVVRQSLVDQRGVVGEMVHRHQLDRGDPQRFEVLDDRRMPDGGIRAPHLFGDVGMGLGEALDVRLVDDGVGVLEIRRAIGAPVEERVDDHRFGHARGGVVVVAAVLVTEVVAEQRLIPVEDAVDGLGIRIEEQLVRVAPLACAGVVWAVHAVAVPLAGLDVRQEAVPDECVHLGQRDSGFAAVGVEQAQFDALGDLAEQCEVGAGAVVGGSERIGLTAPDLLRNGVGNRDLGQGAPFLVAGTEQGDDTVNPRACAC